MSTPKGPALGNDVREVAGPVPSRKASSIKSKTLAFAMGVMSATGLLTFADKLRSVDPAHAAVVQNMGMQMMDTLGAGKQPASQLALASEARRSLTPHRRSYISKDLG